MKHKLGISLITAALLFSGSVTANIKNESVDHVKNRVQLVSNYNTYKMDRVSDTLSRIERMGASFDRVSRRAVLIKYDTLRKAEVDEKLLELLKTSSFELEGLSAIFYADSESEVTSMNGFNYLVDIGLNVEFVRGVYKCDKSKGKDCRSNAIQIFAPRG